MIDIKFYEINEVDDSLLTYAVIVSRYLDKWVWCKNKTRKGWEVPGGHREENETIDETAKRELYEETGATEYSLMPICVYSVKQKNESFGMLYFAEINEFGNLPDTEIEKIDFFFNYPDELSFPLIQPKLSSRVEEELSTY